MEIQKTLPSHWIPLSKGQSKKLGFALSNRTIKGIAVNGICVFPLCRAVRNLFISKNYTDVLGVFSQEYTTIDNRDVIMNR